MSDLHGGLKLKSSGAPAAAAPAGGMAPPPIPGAPAGVPGSPVAAPAPLAPTGPSSRFERPVVSSHPDGFPPDREIGGLGKFIVWFFALFVFGGGLAGWLLIGTYAEAALADTMGGFGQTQESDMADVMAGSSFDAADPEDLEFLAQELGMDREALGLPPATAGGEVALSGQPNEVNGWPRLDMSGVIAAKRNRKAGVMLNGVLVRVGQSIQGVDVIAVEDNAAALSYRGETIWMRTGDSTGSG